MSTLSIGLPLFVIFFQILSLLSLHAHPTSVDPTSSSLVGNNELISFKQVSKF